ncbi:MAG: FtsX-like permease family protein, partial [Planctomycetota bacterium]
MSFCKLLLGNLRHFWRTHLGVVLGAACGTAVLVGALAVGDSVRQSLAEQAALRIGRIDAALVAKERFFRADLAERIAQDLEGAAAAPALTFRGICSASGGSSRAGIVDVFGVDERFFALGPRRDKLEEEEKEKSRRGKRQGAKEAKGRQEEEGLPARGKAFLNERLARQLAVDAGDSILLRVEKPSSMPRDLVLATIEDVSLALRVEVERVLSEEEFGRFSLRASQVPPFNLFVSLEWLQSELGLPDRANMLLIGASQSRNDLTRRADRALAMRWTLADAGLELRSLAGSELFELRSERVFLAEPVADAMLEIDARLAGVLGYFVNRLRCGEHATPYSVLAAIGPLSAAPADPALRAMLSLSPRDSATDGIVLNEWLAKDLGAGIGDRVEIDYFVPALRLEEESHAFRVQSVVPIEGPAADPGLMPEFPGLAGSAHCRDWEPGIPIDLDRIRDADERYWDEHRGTPKAFVDLELGQRLWQNRFGQLTAIRGPARLLGRVATELPKKLDPARLGLYFQDLRGSAMAAGSPATDFGGLFLGLSFFLIVAALLLTALLFVFGIEQRASEIGVLLAVGFRPRTARRLFLGEALVLAALGGGLGAFLGIAYTSGVLYGLGTIWRDAVGDASLQLHARPSVIALGTLAAIVAALLAILLAFRKLHERPAVELLQSRGGVAGSPPPSGSVSRYLAIACPILALLLVLMVGTSSAQAAGAFFGAGALLLLGGLSACRLLLTRFATPSPHGIPSVLALGVRNSGRRPSRSLATIALLASGTFLVVAVQAHRLEPPRDVRARASGTGGFALFGRSRNE